MPTKNCVEQRTSRIFFILAVSVMSSLFSGSTVQAQTADAGRSLDEVLSAAKQACREARELGNHAKSKWNILQASKGKAVNRLKLRNDYDYVFRIFTHKKSSCFQLKQLYKLLKERRRNWVDPAPGVVPGGGGSAGGQTSGGGLGGGSTGGSGSGGGSTAGGGSGGGSAGGGSSGSDGFLGVTVDKPVTTGR